MLQENIASDVENLLTGILSLKNVSPAILTNHGTLIHTCANAVHLPEQFRQENALVQLPRLNGMPIQKPAAVLLILLVIIVNHVLLLDSGIKAATNVHVPLQKPHGILQLNSVNARLENMETTALNVHPQDTGI